MSLIQVERDYWLPDRSLNFTAGTSDHGSGASLDSINTGTFGALIWVDAVQNGDRICFKSAGAGTIHSFNITTDGGGGLSHTIQGGTTYTKASDGGIRTGQWQFVFSSFNAGVSGDIYIGDLKNPATIPTYITNNNGATPGNDGTGNFFIGSNSTPTQNFSGRIAWFGAWRRQFGLPELLAMQRNPLVLRADAAIFVFPGDGGPASMLDISSNANNGTATGTTLENGPAQAYTQPSVSSFIAVPFGMMEWLRRRKNRIRKASA